MYDGNTNSLLSISKNDFDVLSGNEKNNVEYDVVIKRYQDQGYCLPQNVSILEHNQSCVLECHLARRIEQMTLQVTQNCNLRCGYCVYSGRYDNRGHSNKTMSFETAKKSIDFLVEHSADLDRAALAFYGGEPLLEIGLIRKCIEYINEVYPYKKFSYTLTTNATLLIGDTVKFLSDNEFQVMVSIDGPEEMHNKHRRFPDNRGSFSTIIKNLETIKEEYPRFYERISVNMVVTPEHDYKCVVDYFDTDASLKFLSAHSSLLNQYGFKDRTSYSELYSITYKHESFKLLLYMIGKIDVVNVSNLFLPNVSNHVRLHKYLEPVKALPSKCHPGGPCIPGAKRLFVNAYGLLYPCERVREDSEVMNIGSLDGGFDIDKASSLLNFGKVTPEACMSCWCMTHCSLCAASADDGEKLSPELKSSYCAQSQFSFVEQLRDYCFLVENGYDFEKEGEDNSRFIDLPI